MQQIDAYIDELFSGIANSKKARQKKAELKKEYAAKFEKYKKIKKTDEAAFEAVKAEIGSAAELRESLPATGSAENIVAAVFFVIFAVACVVAAYFRIAEESYELMYEKFFEFFKITFARPMRWGTGGFLILWTLARYSVKIGPFIKVNNRALKWVLLIVSALFFIVYIAGLVCIWTGSLPGFTAAILPTMETLWSGGQYFMFIPGAMLLLGMHK